MPTIETIAGQRVMSLKQVAEYLGIGERSVRRKVLSGVLPLPVRFGRNNYWFVDSLDLAI